MYSPPVLSCPVLSCPVPWRAGSSSAGDGLLFFFFFPSCRDVHGTNSEAKGPEIIFSHCSSSSGLVLFLFLFSCAPPLQGKAEDGVRYAGTYGPWNQG